MSLITTLYSYSLQPILINQCWTEYEWIRLIKFQYCWLTDTQHLLALMSSEKINSLLISDPYIIGYQDCDLISHDTYVLCISFMHEWRNLQFKVDFVGHIFEKPFKAILITLWLIFCKKSAERKSLKEKFPIFMLFFRCMIQGFTSNKPIHNLQSQWQQHESKSNSIFFQTCIEEHLHNLLCLALLYRYCSLVI